MYTWAIIGVSSLLSIVAFQREDLLLKLALRPYANSRQRNWLPLLSSGFIHANYGHLFFNMFTLFFFGPIAEKALVYWYGLNTGGILYLGFYLLSIILSNVPTFLRNRNNPQYASLGASGAVSAVLFASILIFPLEKVCLFAIICIPGFILAPLFLIYSHQASRDPRSIINHEAHFYGAIFGLIFLGILQPALFPRFFEQILQYIASI